MAYDDYVKAGGIARKLRETARKMVEPGAKLLDLALAVDRMTEQEGGKPAFPVNISIDDVAAHYTPSRDDALVFSKGQVVKVDIGVAVNNCPVDTALTVTLSKDDGLQKAAEAALDAALRGFGAKATLHDIGGLIEAEIVKRGFRPIENLTGHSMAEGTLHAGLSIPNYATNDNREIGLGVFAIEPFSTTGEGKVKNSEPSQIYRLISTRMPRMPRLRALQEEIAEKFGTFPFAARWVEDEFGLKMLVREGILHNYPILKEVSGGIVAQAEHTVVVDEKGVHLVT